MINRFSLLVVSPRLYKSQSHFAFSLLPVCACVCVSAVDANTNIPLHRHQPGKRIYGLPLNGFAGPFIGCCSSPQAAAAAAAKVPLAAANQRPQLGRPQPRICAALARAIRELERDREELSRPERINQRCGWSPGVVTSSQTKLTG